jgi:hypothetical protein
LVKVGRLDFLSARAWELLAASLPGVDFAVAETDGRHRLRELLPREQEVITVYLAG